MDNNEFYLNDRLIGYNHPPLVIAEIGINHSGSLRVAKKMVDAAAEVGVDGLILVAAGAGGHAGTLHPIPLINEIKKIFNKTILLSGCISNGNDVASAMQMGANLAYIGTRFINTIESRAEVEYQRMIIKSKAGDIIYTAAVSGVNGNFLKGSLAEAGFTEEMLTMKNKMDFGKELDPEKKKKKAWKAIWSAGQGVTNIDDVLTVKDLINRLKDEFKAALGEQNKLLELY